MSLSLSLSLTQHQQTASPPSSAIRAPPPPQPQQHHHPQPHHPQPTRFYVCLSSLSLFLPCLVPSVLLMPFVAISPMHSAVRSGPGISMCCVHTQAPTLPGAICRRAPCRHTQQRGPTSFMHTPVHNNGKESRKIERHPARSSVVLFDREGFSSDGCCCCCCCGGERILCCGYCRLAYIPLGGCGFSC